MTMAPRIVINKPGAANLAAPKPIVGRTATGTRQAVTRPGTVKRVPATRIGSSNQPAIIKPTPGKQIPGKTYPRQPIGRPGGPKQVPNERIRTARGKGFNPETAQRLLALRMRRGAGAKAPGAAQKRFER